MQRGETTERSKLLAHRRDLETLVSHLAVDPDAAADVVQETWLRALASPPRHRTNIGSWLRTIARNTLQRRVGRQQRGAELEQAASVSGEPETAEAIVERRELVQLVQQAVLDLQEPYRSVIRLRYFEERSPQEIAESLGRSPSTVHNQLHRGRERLRRQLDRSYHGSRALWLPLALGRSRAAPDALPAEVARLGTRLPLVPLGLLGVVVGVVGLRLALSEPRRGPGRGEHAVAAASPTAPAPALSAPVPDPSRVAVAPPPSALGAREQATARASEPGPAGWIDVTVVDEWERPVERAHVQALTLELGQQEQRGRGLEARTGARQLAPGATQDTDADGRVSVALGPANRISPSQFASRQQYALVNVYAAGHVQPDLHCVPFPEGTRRALRVTLVAPALSCRIRVLDEVGRPVVAEVGIWSAPDEEHLDDAPPDGIRLLSYPGKERTDEDGVCVHRHLARGRHRITVEAEGFVRHQGWIETPAPQVHVVVLERGGAVAGAVFDQHGPVDGALVWAEIGEDNERSTPRTESDAEGHFRLEGLPSRAAWLFARKADDPGLVACELLAPPSPGADRQWFPTLRRSSGLRLALRDPDGAPLPGHVVYLTLDSGLETPPWQRVLEADERAEVTLFDVPELELRVEVFRSKNDLYARGLPLAVLRGILPRQEPYVITLPREDDLPGALSGAVLDAGGAPLEGVRLFARGGDRSTFQRLGQSDAQGRFRCERLPPGAYDLVACCAGLGTAALGRIQVDAASELRRSFSLERTIAVDPAWLPAQAGTLSHVLIADRQIGDTRFSWTVCRSPAPPPSRLLAGSYRLQVLDRGRLLQERSFVVTH